jgi:hypothetical protein
LTSAKPSGFSDDDEGRDRRGSSVDGSASACRGWRKATAIAF